MMDHAVALAVGKPVSLWRLFLASRFFWLAAGIVTGTVFGTVSSILFLF